MTSGDFSGQAYQIKVLGERYRYRALTRRELRDFQKEAKGFTEEFEDLICKACVMDTPENFPGWENCLAGIPTTLARAILDTSGFLSEESMARLEQEAAEWAMTQEARFDSLICFCFPSRTPDDLDNMDPRTWHTYAAMAQLICGGIYGIDPTSFLDPSADKPRQKQTAAPAPSRNADELAALAEQITGIKSRKHGSVQADSQIETEGVFSFSR